LANIIAAEFKKYFAGLASTHEVCAALGTTLSASSNLFIGIEPSNEIATRCLTLIPYAGAPPSPEGDRQESNVQIRLKIPDSEAGWKTMQSIINDLHGNEDVCASCYGRVSAIQSSPILLEIQEGGEFYIFVSNYSVKHTKL
jgi:hypothetical protein